MNLSFVAGLGAGVGLTFGAVFIKELYFPKKNDDNQEEEEEDDDEWSDIEDDDDELGEEEEESLEEEDSDCGAVKVKKAKDLRLDRGPHKMMLVVRKDLKMGQGKIAAQCGHATLAAYQVAKRQAKPALTQWARQGQAKIAAKVDSEDALMEVYAKALSLGLVAAVIRDAGRTQIDPGTKTVVAVGPGPVDLVDKVTGTLKLL